MNVMTVSTVRVRVMVMFGLLARATSNARSELGAAGQLPDALSMNT